MSTEFDVVVSGEYATGLESDGSSFRCMAPSEESGHRQDGDLDVLAVQSVRQAVERLEGKAGT